MLVNSFPSKFLLLLVFLVLIGEQVFNVFSGASIEQGEANKFNLLLAFHFLFISISFPKLFVYLINKNFINFRMPIALYLLIISLAMSLSQGAKITPLPIISAFFLIVFHIFVVNSSRSYSFNLLGHLGIAYCLGTIFLPFIFDVDLDLLYSLSSFSGIASSRTTLGFICGVFILIWINSADRKQIIFVPLGLYILLLSESRASFIALSACSLYLIWRNLIHSKTGIAKKILLISFLVFIAILAYLFSSQFQFESRNVTIFQDDGLRFEKIFVSLNEILEKPFFGRGGLYSQVYTNGEYVEPHNILLQSFLDFGLFPALSYFFYLGKLYSLTATNGRLFLIYWFVFGLFHPGFAAFFADMNFIFILLLSFSYSRVRQRC